jgi:hypothetical protein
MRSKNSKGILFVSTDCNSLPFPASIGPRFIGSLNLSIYRLRKIWFGVAAMALATSASIAAAEAAGSGPQNMRTNQRRKKAEGACSQLTGVRGCAPPLNQRRR